MKILTFIRRALPALAALPLAAQLPKPPALPGLPPPPDPVEVVRQFMKIDPARMLALKGQVKAPEVDLPGALWVAAHAHISPEVVIQARLGGLSWMDIFVKFKVPVTQVMVPVEKADCPPYGKAWGYHRKQNERRGPRGRAEPRETEPSFNDEEISEFIKLRAISAVYGTPVEELAVRHCAGRDMRGLIGEEHERKHGRGHGEDGERHKEKKHGKGHEGRDGDDGDDEDHGEGHGRGHGG